MLTALLMVIGGAAGGALGWLFDRNSKRGEVESEDKPEAACENT